jgi:hypothetical protein
MKKTLGLLLIISTAVTCYAQKTKIVLNLKQDSTYYLSQNSTLTIDQAIPGHDQVITTVITGLMAHKVIAVKDTTYDLAVEYENIGIKMQMGGNDLMSVDTKNKDSQDIMTKVMLGLLHKPIIITITTAGKVLEVKNIDNLFAGLFDSFTQLSDQQKTQIKSQIEKSFGEKAFKSNFQDAFAELPAAAVGVNDTWVSDTDIETIAVAKIKTTYVLNGITDKNYVIHGDAAITSSGTADFVRTNGMPMRYNNMSGTYVVDIRLDKATGWITDSKVTKNIKGDIEIKDNPQVPGGITFPMTIVGDIYLTNK